MHFHKMNGGYLSGLVIVYILVGMGVGGGGACSDI